MHESENHQYERPPMPEEFPPVQLTENCSDLGNARRFARLYAEVARYVADRGIWLCWNGKFWEPDTTGSIMRLAKKTAENIYHEGIRKGGDSGDKLKAFSLKTESSKNLKAMIELAQSEEAFVVCGKDLDNDPLLLNVQNGTVNLKTGELRPHDRSDMITKISSVDMPANHQGDCMIFKRFLGEIFHNDKDLIEFVQRVIGYFLTGVTREQKFFYFYGTGANGKSTLLDILSSILAPHYAKTVPSEIFMARDSTGGATPEIAQLPGVRLVLSNEVGEGRRMDEPLVKSLTGGDVISARQLYKQSFEFVPSFKPVMAGNHKPEIRGTDTGIWRRIVLIPFTVSIPTEKQDRRLPEKLNTELPEILRWAVQGCLKWQREGLSIPKAVMDATNEYRSDMDIIGSWLTECCAVGDGYDSKSSKLYESYSEWTKENGYRAVAQRKFSGSMKDRGFQSIKRSTVHWIGIGLLNDYATASKRIC